MDQVHRDAGVVVTEKELPVEEIGVDQGCGEVHDTAVDHHHGDGPEDTEGNLAAPQKSFSESTPVRKQMLPAENIWKGARAPSRNCAGGWGLCPRILRVSL